MQPTKLIPRWTGICDVVVHKLMITYDHLSCIVLTGHSGGVRVSECGKERVLYLTKTVGLKATVSVCTPCNVVSLSTTSVNCNTAHLIQDS